MQYAREKVSNVDKGNNLSLTHFSATQAISSQGTNTQPWLLLLLSAAGLSLNTGKCLNHSTGMDGQGEGLEGTERGTGSRGFIKQSDDLGWNLKTHLVPLPAMGRGGNGWA